MKWIELKITTTPEIADAVECAMYDIEVGGLAIEDPRDILDNNKRPWDWDYFDVKGLDPNKVVIKAYLSPNSNYNEKIFMLKEKLKLIAAPLQVNCPEMQITEVDDQDWSEQWKKYYKSVRISDRVIIKPTWEEYNLRNTDEIIIEMDPGMAFGTGTHETTQMSVQLLEKYVTESSSVLDIGCGSGILGITALKLGAHNCLSVDIDHDAVRVSESNAIINGVNDRITIKKGDLLDVVSGQFNIVVANIIADVIMILSDTITPYLTPDGIFIVSGIINDRYDEVKQHLTDNNFVIKQELMMGEWVAVAVMR